MTRSLHRRMFLSALLLCGLAGSAAWAGEMVANPKYQAWTKFKPGSNSTVTSDMEVSGNKIHIEMTRTLISLDNDKAVIESKSVVNVMGHDHESPARQETVTAKTDSDQIKQTGEKEIQAMDKTFKCKVYEAKGDPNAKAARGAPNPEAMKATVYSSDEVPGGLVRLEASDATGKEMTFVLTKMEAK